jgi:nitrous oxide reductase accessory protein NosL
MRIAFNGKFTRKEVTHMKKLISLTLVLALATVFAAGCKKKEEAPAPAPAPAVEAPKPVQAPMSAAKGSAPVAPAEAPKK